MSDDPREPAEPNVDGLDMSDDQLLAELRTAIEQNDPPPERLSTIAKAALTWRTIDAELAELAFDSTRDLAGVRDQTLQRQITFETADLEIEIMVVDTASRRLVGQLVPAVEAMVVLIAGDDGEPERFTTTADHLGRFGFDDVPTGPVGFAVLDADGRPTVQTERLVL